MRYADALAEPVAVSEQIAAFLGLELDQAAMAREIDPALRREKKV